MCAPSAADPDVPGLVNAVLRRKPVSGAGQPGGLCFLGRLREQGEAEGLAFELWMWTVDRCDGAIRIEEDLASVMLDESRPRALDVHAVTDRPRRAVRVENLPVPVPLDDGVPVRPDLVSVIDMDVEARHGSGPVEERSIGADFVVDDMHRETLWATDISVDEDPVLLERSVVRSRRGSRHRTEHHGGYARGSDDRRHQQETSALRTAADPVTPARTTRGVLRVHPGRLTASSLARRSSIARRLITAVAWRDAER
jgi:hypothetical protein